MHDPYNKKIYNFTVGNYSYYTEQRFFAMLFYRRPLGDDDFIEIDHQKFFDAENLHRLNKRRKDENDT